MSRESKLLTFFFIGFLMTISYSYIVDEVQSVSDDDPTHTGKAMIATLTPYIWIMLIILDGAVCLYIIGKELN